MERHPGLFFVLFLFFFSAGISFQPTQLPGWAGGGWEQEWESKDREKDGLENEDERGWDDEEEKKSTTISKVDGREEREGNGNGK